MGYLNQLNEPTYPEGYANQLCEPSDGIYTLYKLNEPTYLEGYVNHLCEPILRSFVTNARNLLILSEMLMNSVNLS